MLVAPFDVPKKNFAMLYRSVSTKISLPWMSQASQCKRNMENFQFNHVYSPGHYFIKTMFKYPICAKSYWWEKLNFVFCYFKVRDAASVAYRNAILHYGKFYRTMHLSFKYQQKSGLRSDNSGGKVKYRFQSRLDKAGCGVDVPIKDRKPSRPYTYACSGRKLLCIRIQI